MLRVTVEVCSGPFVRGDVLGIVEIWNTPPGLEENGIASYLRNPAVIEQ